MKEANVEAYLRHLVSREGWECIKLNPLGLVGVPDRLILASEGRCIFVELKAPGVGVRSVKQRWWHNRLIGLGFSV